jgi:hypothetical protein
MTDRQRHILRVLADPANPATDPWGLPKLASKDREAIQAALDFIEQMEAERARPEVRKALGLEDR